MGSITTVYVFKGSVKGYNTLSSFCFLYVFVNSLSFLRSFKNKFDNWSTLYVFIGSLKGYDKLSSLCFL